MQIGTSKVQLRIRKYKGKKNKTGRNSKCKKKKKKLNVEDAINALRKSVNCETLAADQEQNLSRVSKAAVFIKMISEKEKTLRELTNPEKKLEKEFKRVQTQS